MSILYTTKATATGGRDGRASQRRWPVGNHTFNPEGTWRQWCRGDQPRAALCGRLFRLLPRRNQICRLAKEGQTIRGQQLSPPQSALVPATMARVLGSMLRWLSLCQAWKRNKLAKSSMAHTLSAPIRKPRAATSMYVYQLIDTLGCRLGLSKEVTSRAISRYIRRHAASFPDHQHRALLPPPAFQRAVQ